jgi:transposase InsO family protein
MDLRLQFISDHLSGVFTISELSREYQISRKTAYKWIDRYEAGGATALVDRSRRPHHLPNATANDLVQALLTKRRRHPHWGAKKLLKLLSQEQPDRNWPGRSTACDIFSRHELVREPRRRRIIGHSGKPTTVINAPNQLWAADFKGQFKTRDGYYCYPLTVTDGFSRYVLGCQALSSTAVTEAKPVFRRLFQEFGLPECIRTDNGGPFASVSLARLSTLSAWFIRLGIKRELIEPGKPYQNGSHERMHRTLKAETTKPPAANRATQQRRFNPWRHEFNYLRPHEALSMDTPGQHYQASPRPYPERLPPLEYPRHFETRRVGDNGCIRWRSERVHVSFVCAHEYVGLEEVDTGIWNVFFGSLKLGRLIEKELRIQDAYGLWRRPTRKNV